MPTVDHHREYLPANAGTLTAYPQPNPFTPQTKLNNGFVPKKYPTSAKYPPIRRSRPVWRIIRKIYREVMCPCALVSVFLPTCK